MSIWAVVPMKAVRQAKRRLAPVLPDRMRERLVEAMFQHVLQCLRDVSCIHGIAVVSSDPSLADGDVLFVDDPGTGLNAAIRAAVATTKKEGAATALILPADLPLIERRDIDAILDAGRDNPVVMVGDRDNAGTNALLLSPPDRVDPGFGEASLDRHRSDAIRSGVTPIVLDLPRIRFDIDDKDAVDELRRLRVRGFEFLEAGELVRS